MATTAQTIQGYYNTILGRTGSVTEVAYWVNQVDNGGIPLSQVETDFATSHEALTNVAPIVEMYQADLGRAPDNAGLTYWVGLEESGTSLATIGADIAASAESQAHNGFTVGAAPTTASVTNAYEHILDRPPESAAVVASWVASGLSGAQIVAAISGSAEAQADFKSAVSTYLSTGGGTTSNSVTLAPGVDHAVGTTIVGSLSPFFYDGVGPTLNSGDTVTGSGSNNTLTLADGYGQGADIIPAGITISNIQNVGLQTAGNAGSAGGSPFDTSPYSSVTSTTVTSSGANTDIVQASSTSTITVNHNATVGGVQTYGGSNTTVSTNGTGGVSVGGNGVNQQPAATGTITVNANGAGVGAGAVTVLGGDAVNVTVATASATGNIAVGNTGLSSLNKADNPSGAINIVSNSLAGVGNLETILGGTTVTVAAKGDTVRIGDATATTASNQPSGAVTVTDLLPIAYDDLTGPGTTHNATKGGAITVNGGTNVNVTTNTGGGVAVGTPGKAGTYATGTVTVTDTSSDLKGAFGIGAYTFGPATSVVGGTGVTVTEAGGAAIIGSATAADDPSGAISVTETAASHTAIRIDGGSGVTVAAQGQGVTVGSLSGTSGAQSITQASVYSGNALGSSNGTSAVTDDGGTTVTVNTTGGNVAVGSATHAPTGAVAITNTFSGAGTANASTVTVLGGAAVGITETNTTSGAINVGAMPVLNSVGTAAKNLASDPTGNVTINNSVTNGTTTTYGTSATTVYTNGATAVSVTGAGATTIADANDLTPTSGTVGTSTLATVNLDGVAGAVTINSGALTALTIADSLKSATTATTVNTTALPGFSPEGAHTLALTLSNDSNTNTSVTDPTATALTIGTTGTTADNIGIFAAKATSLTFSNAAALTVAGANMATSGTDTITATGAGALTLGNTTLWTGAGNLASINASTASGAVTAEINGNVTAFTGGSGNDVVTVDTGAGKTINGGTGSNTVILTAAASAYNPLANPTGPISADFTNFQTLGLAGAAIGPYDVSGFSGVTIAATGGATALTNAGAGETLTFTGAPTGPTSWALKTDTSNDALNVTVGVDGTATTTTQGISAGTLSTTSIETITVNSVGASTTVASPTTDQNTITLTDAGTKTLDVTGHANVAVTDTGGAVTTINVSSTAAADVSNVVAAAGGITITGGAGLLTASTADTVNTTPAAKGAQVDSVTTGSGGGIITVGYGGGWVPGALNTGAYSAGSETINLSASAGVTDTLDVADGAISTFNGTKGGVTGFVTGVSLSDQLTYNSPSKTVISNVTAPVGVMTVNGAVNAAGVLGAGLAAVLANLNYTVSNGVITFSASGGHVLSDFTTGQLVSAAEIIVNGAASQIAMFSTGGSTYVVTDDAARTLATTAVGANADSITDLVGTSGILGFGSTDAANTVVVTDLNTVSAGNTGSATASNTYNDTGFARDNFTAAGVATTVAATGVTTYNNLAASAELDIGNTGALHIGSIVTTQVGASGSNSLTVQTNTNSVIIDSLTVAGDSLVKFDPSTGNLNNTVTQLIDSTNTMKTITVAGNGNSSTTLDLAAITGTALTTIDATIALAAVTLGDGAALSQAGLTVLGGVNAVTIGNWTTTPLGSLGLSGANDVVTIGSLAASNTATDKVFASGAANTITVYGNTANVTAVTASGAGDIISAGVGANTITANGAGDTITVGNSAATASVATNQTIHASGVGDTITFASKTTPTSGATGSAITYTGASTIDGGLPGIGIGNNSTINFGTNGIGGTENVVLTGDVTGATSSGSYAFITLNNLGFGDSMTFSNATNEVAAGGTFGASQVNVASTTTLAGALDLAAATDAMSQQSGTTAAGLINANTGVLDWFQFGGNTYITEAVNSTSAAATHTALGAGDAVVKIGGLVDLSGYNLSGHTVGIPSLV